MKLDRKDRGLEHHAKEFRFIPQEMRKHSRFYISELLIKVSVNNTKTRRKGR